MSLATVRKLKRGRGKRTAYVVRKDGKDVKTFEDNGKLGVDGACDLAQKLARKLNGGN